MKVVEKGADRVAHAHIHVEGQVNPLEEFGEYVDANDKAICCYVPVEEGLKIRVDGRFTGPTHTVAYDVKIDGLCRKANSYIGKSVQLQKNKKLDFEKFLYQTPDGIIDTDMLVTTRSGSVVLSKEAPETIGTIELRVYITRQFGVEHEIDDARRFDKVEDDMDTARYKDIAPQYQMTFEKNCSTLEGSKANREKKKINAKRPGTEPWAIFRFHYRSKESILKKKMELTFEAGNKDLAKTEPHALELDPVPTLLLGSKPAGKNDGDTSVRTSSPVPSETPSTPSKGSGKARPAQPKLLARKPKPKSTTSTTASTSDMEPATNAGFPVAAEPSIAFDLNTSTTGDSQSTHARAKENLSSAAAAKIIANDNPGNDGARISTGEGDSNSTTAVSTDTTKKTAKTAAAASTEGGVKNLNNSVKKTLEKPNGKQQTNLVDKRPQTLVEEVFNIPTMPISAELPSTVDSTTLPKSTDGQTALMSNINDSIKNGSRPFSPLFKKDAAKPARIDTTTSTVMKKPINPPTPVTPTKRPTAHTLTPPPDLKRIKTDGFAPLTPARLSRQPSASPSPRPLSIEAQVAEQRRQLEAMRKKRAEVARKQAVIDEQMAPYKQRMAEELERLRQEMADEEMLIAQEEQEYSIKVEMLKELKQADGGI